MRRRVVRVSFDGRRRTPSPVAEQVASSTGGVISPGVRARRQLESHERDWNERLRLSLEARRGYSSGPTFWRS